MTGFITKKITKPTKKLGSILRASRTKKELTLEEVEKSTKICLKYLEALESGKYEDLPADAYNIGFVRLYASFLKLNPDLILTMYREERSSYRLNPQEKIQFAPKKAREWAFLVTPTMLAVVGTLLLFGSLVGYIAFQLNKFAQPPVITITNSPSEFTTTKDLISIKGNASGGSIVKMNSEPINVTSNGDFSQEVQLSPGLNVFNISARNRAEKESYSVVKVLYHPDLAKLPLYGTNE